MDGDLTDYIPDLLLAEEADEIDSIEMSKTYGIESIFKIRCEVVDIDQSRNQPQEEGMSSEEESSGYLEASLRLAFILPAHRAINLID